MAYSKITPAATGSNPTGHLVLRSATGLFRFAPVRFTRRMTDIYWPGSSRAARQSRSRFWNHNLLPASTVP